MNYTYGYARVSTKDQNLATQLDTLTAAGCDKIFTEKISGASTARPQLENLLAILRPGDTVMVSRFTRLGRNSRHLLELIEHFTNNGVFFRALDLDMDTRTPTGKLIAGIFAQLAEYQREEILEKTSHGRQLAVERGQHMGRRAGRDTEKLAKVQKALEKGLSVQEVVEVTGVSLASVKRYRKALEQPGE